ncbi:hypothetical protein NLI96_g5759 [Meripilus lineatus]|uniref:Uncharacterized protein n=1 Tax=Meripilus lineatus TaxID=2056292 RepID=A0AAD5V472_9APHY|nr:hypothetical protein NLI96_g5759 [Physisporinus lineatus]
MYLTSRFSPIPPFPNKNIEEILFNFPGQEGLPDHTLHIDALTGRRRSKKEFAERVRDASTALGSPASDGGLGLSGEAGDIVGICSTNCMEYITLVHSLLAITTPFALISAFSTPFELAHALRVSGATRLFVQPSVLSRVQAAAREVGLPDDRIHILEGHDFERKSLEDLIYDARLRSIPRVPIRPAKQNTLAYLIFSSGTSGLPKAVMISHGNLYATVMSFAIARMAELEVDPQPVTLQPVVGLAVLPFHHAYGLLVSCITPVVGLNTCVILPTWDVRSVLRAVPRFKINVLVMVPSGLHQIANTKEVSEMDLSSVSVASSGAAYLPPLLADKVKKLLPTLTRLTEGYGLSECTLSALRKPVPGILGGQQPKRNSTGILLPGMEARIVREDGSEAGYNEPGELWLRGMNVALGYYKNPKATGETFVDGWLHTGDKFKVDETEAFYFVDRAKDTLKVSGVQVSPTEIEEVIRSHPGKLVVDVSVAGVSGGRTQDEKVPRAWIVLSEAGIARGEASVAEELNSWVKKNLSPYKWLRGGLEVVQEIPKSPTGKVLRRHLQDKYEEQSKSRAKL